MNQTPVRDMSLPCSSQSQEWKGNGLEEKDLPPVHHEHPSDHICTSSENLLPIWGRDISVVSINTS